MWCHRRRCKPDQKHLQQDQEISEQLKVGSETENESQGKKNNQSDVQLVVPSIAQKKSKSYHLSKETKKVHMQDQISLKSEENSKNLESNLKSMNEKYQNIELADWQGF